jgi:hypothetical protein
VGSTPRHTDSLTVSRKVTLRHDLSSKRAPHRDRTTNSRPKLLKMKQYLVKRPQSGLENKTYWLTDWLSAVKLLWLLTKREIHSVFEAPYLGVKRYRWRDHIKFYLHRYEHVRSWIGLNWF